MPGKLMVFAAMSCSPSNIRIGYQGMLLLSENLVVGISAGLVRGETVRML